MPLLAQLVVEYVVDVSQLVEGVQAATGVMAEMNASVETSSAYLSGLSESSVLAGGNLAELSANATGAGAALEGVDAALVGADAGLDSMAVSAGTASASLDTTTASLGETSAAADASKVSLGGVGLALAAVGVAAVAGGVVATKMAGDFQSGITGLETGAGELHGNLQMVSDGILKMAGDTGTATKSLTEGMFQIESAGYKGADGLKVLTDAAEGAKTGHAQLKDVANGVTTAMVDYNIPVSKAAEVTNDLVAVVKNGKTSMGELSSSLKNVLPVASSAGISLGDVSAAMATMTGEGVPAGQSATYLKTMILSLEAPSSKGAAALANIGLSSQDVATKMKKSLPDALTMITDHLKSKFPEGSAAYTSALKDITGGSSSLSAVLDLTGDHMKTLKANVDNISSSVKQGGNSIQGWSATQGDFNQKMDQAKGTMESLGIKIGTALLPVMSRMLDAFNNPGFQSFAAMVGTTLVNGVNGLITVITTLVNWGIQLTAFFQHNQLAMDLLQGALVAAAILIGGPLVLAFIGWAAAALLAAINTLIACAPIILIGALIALVVAGIILAIQHWGAIVAWLTGVWSAVASFFGWLWGQISGFFVGVGQWFADRFNEAKNGVVGAFGAIGAWFGDRWHDIQNAFGAVGNWFHNLWQGVCDDFNSVLGGLGTLATNIWNGITGAVKSGFNFVIDLVNGVITNIDNIKVGGFGVNIPLIPHLASGIENFIGGAALVGEKGPELVTLPKGANVMNAQRTASLLGSFNNIKGTPTSLGANTNASPSQGGGKQEIHIHNYHYLDGKDITDNVQTRVVKAGRKGPIR